MRVHCSRSTPWRAKTTADRAQARFSRPGHADWRTRPAWATGRRAHHKPVGRPHPRTVLATDPRTRPADRRCLPQAPMSPASSELAVRGAGAGRPMSRCLLGRPVCYRQSRAVTRNPVRIRSGPATVTRYRPEARNCAARRHPSLWSRKPKKEFGTMLPHGISPANPTVRAADPSHPAGSAPRNRHARSAGPSDRWARR